MVGKKLKHFTDSLLRLRAKEETACVILLYVTCRADELIDPEGCYNDNVVGLFSGSVGSNLGSDTGYLRTAGTGLSELY
jgi:hypothetical protein